MNETIFETYTIEGNKFMKLQDMIAKLCKKFKITCQQDVAYNGDLHLQFRKKIKYGESETCEFFGTEFAEWYIGAKDIRIRRNIFILLDLRGFIRMSFKMSHKKHTI